MLAGSSEWWIVVRSTVLDEAEIMLRDYKAALVTHKAGSPEHYAAGIVLQRVNTELHRVVQVKQKRSWRKAITNICGNDVYEDICAEMARIELFERQKEWA